MASFVELLRSLVGLPARPGFLTVHQVGRRIRHLQEGDLTFVALRQALGDGEECEAAEFGSPLPDVPDMLCEQTARLMTTVGVMDWPNKRASHNQAPTLTSLRRLAASLQRLETNTNATSTVLAKQLNSVLALLKPKGDEQ